MMTKEFINPHLLVWAIIAVALSVLMPVYFPMHLHFLMLWKALLGIALVLDTIPTWQELVTEKLLFDHMSRLSIMLAQVKPDKRSELSQPPETKSLLWPVGHLITNLALLVLLVFI